MKQIRSQREIDEGMAWLLKTDPRLQQVAEQVDEIPLRLQEPGFAGLSRIIVGQQVSTASAAAIWCRLEALITPFEPELFVQAGESIWREAGLSRPKQKSLIELSSVLISNQFYLEDIQELEAGSAVGKLTQIHGIGPWTSQVYLLFCTGHPDIFPEGDLALQIAVQDGLHLDKRPNPATLEKIAQKWSPWKGVAARLFWAYYGQIIKGKNALPV